MKLNEFLKSLLEEGGAIPGASAGGPNAPMSTDSVGKPSNYVGILQRDGSHKGQKKKKKTKKPPLVNPQQSMLPVQKRPVM